VAGRRPERGVMKKRDSWSVSGQASQERARTKQTGTGNDGNIRRGFVYKVRQ